MTENTTTPKKHAPKAAAAFTLSGLLIAGSTVPAIAALADGSNDDNGSINQTQIERLGESVVVSNEYLVVTHSADEEALTDLRVGRAAEWELSVELNPETFDESNPDAPFSDNAELRTFLTYDSEFDAEITVSSDHTPAEGVPASVDADPDATLAEGTEQVGVYEVDSEDRVEITVSIVPGASLGANEEIDLMFSVLATGEFVEPPEDEDEGEEDTDIDDPWLEIVPIPGDEDDEETEPTQEPTQEPTAEPTAEPTETETAEPTATPTETPTETASPTQSPDPTETQEPTETAVPTETQEPTEAAVEETEGAAEPERSPEPTDQTSATPPQNDDDEGTDGHTAAPDEDTADAGDENTESAESTDDTVPDDTAVSSDDEILPPAIADGGDFSNANSSTGRDSIEAGTAGDADSGTTQGSGQNSAAPVEIASGFFNEFSQNVVSIAMFFAGLLTLVGAFALRRKDIGAL